ncbi:MAG: hypothetical protein WKF66_16120 [Pedobacter sp.]
MKKNIAILICLTFLGCSPKKIDLKDLVVSEKSNVDLSEFAKNIREQKGRFELPTKDGVKLVDRGEKIVYYFFAGNDNVTFDKAKIAPVLETKVVTYNGLVSYITVHPDNKDAPELLERMLKSHPAPDSIVYDQSKLTGSEKETALLLKKVMPNLVKEVVDEFDNKTTQYPQQMFWSKNNVLTKLTIDPTNANLNMSVRLITKKAYLDHIVEEYAKPLFTQYDIPYAHLFKN